MLFTYRYVKHDIEKIQIWLDHLVRNVWCKAAGRFHVGLLDTRLREVVIAVADDNRTKRKLFEPIRDLFDLFKNLSVNQRKQFSRWYDANNNIEALCSNSPKHQPVTYAEVAQINADLAEKLKGFYDDLWDRVLGLGPVESEIGTIDAHYKDFIRENNEGKCPYCGYGDIKGLQHSKREAYDHFLPKGAYPFNSVNFKNLAPMCHECNSSYKLKLDPIKHIDPITRKNTGVRRKAFYSYSPSSPGISIDIAFSNTDIENLTSSDITLTFTAPGREEEVDSWKDVFGIEERYKAKCCAKNDGKAWLQQIIEECANPQVGLTSDDLLAQVIRAAERSPYDSANFLKKPFLLACKNAGLIRNSVTSAEMQASAVNRK
ncbi:MAG: hypothetical protein WCS43_01455 [Verrucomicrobiota bacterium]